MAELLSCFPTLDPLSPNHLIQFNPRLKAASYIGTTVANLRRLLRQRRLRCNRVGIHTHRLVRFPSLKAWLRESLLHSVINRRSSVRKSLLLENTLYVLSVILSLAFVSLIILSLALTPLWAREPVEATQSTRPAVGLKKASGHDEVLRRVRERLGEKIRKELVTLPNYDVFDNLLFSLDEKDVVTLSGQVRLPSLKVSAERVVGNLEGVSMVINQIEVLPTSPFDDDIRRDAFRRIYSQSQLNRYALQAVPPIHIIVKRGKLTLEGVVANESDKNMAGIRARQVPNVFDVVNNLRVEESHHAHQ
jgi:hyperosmotically inducible periplasmic protein